MTQANGNGRDKAGKFKELAAFRVSDALNVIRRIGNLSNRASYDYTPEQVGKIFERLRGEINVAEARFTEALAPKEKEKVAPLEFTL